MNFFEHQDRARRQTKWLVFLYILAMICIFLTIHSLVVFCFCYSDKISYWTRWLDPTLLALDALSVFLLIGCCSLFKVVQLSQLQGDGIARSLGGELLTRSTADPREKRLLNIVDEMAIASGISVPNVFLLRNETGINAFAAGFSPERSAIGVTQGALDYLNRDELQGVIAHEFSHILNGDSKINVRLIGILFGLEALVIVGLIIYRNLFYVSLSSGRSRDSEGKGSSIVLAILLFAVGLMAIGWIGMLFSNLIRAAISRQREFLADASAVQFTRNPSGIGGALKKIGSPRIGSAVQNSRSVEASHLFFSSIFSSGFLASLFNTHPDLSVRIKRIDPTFDGRFPSAVEKLRRDDSPDRSTAKSTRPNVLNATITAAALSGSSGKIDDPTRRGAAIASSLANAVGQIQENDLEVAESLLKSIPNEIVEKLDDPTDAKGVVFALLLDENPEVLAKQRTILANVESTERIQTIETTSNLIRTVSSQTRIPIVQLATPTLKRLTPSDYKRFRAVVEELIRCDGRIDLFEYALSQMLLNGLDRSFGLTVPPKIRFALFREIVEPFRNAVSFLAYAGSDDSEAQKKAFQAAFAYFYLESEIVPRSECSLKSFLTDVGTLAQSTPILKQKLLTAFYRCICDDGVITEREGELIRVVSAVLDCPIPIWGDDAKSNVSNRA